MPCGAIALTWRPPGTFPLRLFLAAAIVYRVIAASRRAEAALREANQVLDALVRASPLAIITLDPEGRVTTWNPAAERIFGWPAGEVLGGPQPNVPDDLRGEHDSALAASSRGESLAGFETRRLRRDGSCVDVEIWTAPLRDARGEFSGRLAIVADVTARKQAEAERAELLRRLVTSQEDERRRIARELHDQMGQHLAALMLGLQALQEGSDDGPDREPPGSASSRTRSSSSGRRPTGSPSSCGRRRWTTWACTRPC